MSESKLRAALREMVARWNAKANETQKEYYNDSGSLWDCAREVEEALAEDEPTAAWKPTEEQTNLLFDHLDMWEDDPQLNELLHVIVRDWVVVCQTPTTNGGSDE